MKLNLYYSVKIMPENGGKLDEPLYDAGPFATLDKAEEYILGKHWLHNACYQAVKQTIDVE